MDEKKEVRKYRDIREDFKYDPSPFCDEDERVHRLKEIIQERLDEVDRTIILLYIDCLSTRKLGRRFGLSHTTMRKEVARIKEKILKEYDDIH